MNLTPSQQRIVRQLFIKHTSFAGRTTSEEANTVHTPSAESLEKRGVVQLIPSEERPGKRLVQLTAAGSQMAEVWHAARKVPHASEQPQPPPSPLVSGKRRNRRNAAVAKRARQLSSPQSPPVPEKAKPGEPPAIAKARDRIRKLLKSATNGHPPQAVHLVLAIVNQETGNHKAANQLISEYGLDKLFGLMRFDD